MRKIFTAFVNAVLLLMLFAPLVLLAQPDQERIITGKVADNEGALLPGVSILIKGTTIGTTTDASGVFSLRVNQVNPVLVFSFVGFASQEIEVGSQTVFSVVLASETRNLSEVVITAFGISKEKASLGFSTQTLDGSNLVKAREPNALNGLVGKVAGLTVGASTEMLAAPNLRLRGNSDILFIVDGIPINTDTWNVSPDDIETYTVLKGPNAAALYGFRGQNGAIIITTKRGSGKDRGFSVNINSSTQFQTGFLAKPYTQNEYGLGNTFRYAFGNDPFDRDGSFRRASVFGPRFEGQLVPQYDSPVDPVTGKREGTPWLAKGADNLENFMQTGILTSNNIALGFNDERVDLRVSYTNSIQRGVFPNTRLNINNLNTTMGIKLTEKLKLESNVNVSLQDAPNIPDVTYGPNSVAYSFGIYGSAHFDVRDLKDYWAAPGIPGIQQRNREYGRTNNPYFMAYEWLREHNKTDVYGYLKLSYQISKDLTAQIRTSANSWSALRTEKLPYSAEHYVVPDRAGNYSEDRRKLFESTTDLLITYDKQIGDFKLNVLGGANARNFAYNSSFTSTNNLIVPGVYSFANSQNPVRASSFRSNMLVLAGYSSIDIGYKNYLTLNLTGHWDKLSTLPVGSQNYFYPSAALSTVVSDYVKLPAFVSFVKARGSFAQVQGGLVTASIGPANDPSGANPVFGVSTWLTTYDGPTYANQNTFTTTLPYNNLPGATFTSTLANSALQPFTITSYETGLDMFFLENRLGLDLTYFYTINGPQIFSRTTAPSSGFSRQNVNDIVTAKEGWEVALTGIPVMINRFKWETMVNLATFVETYKEINDPSGSIIANGGVVRVGDRVDKAFSVNLLRTPDGQVIHDNAGLPLRGPSGIQGNSFVGYGNSTWNWAINNRFSYKNWGLSFQFDGRVGGVIYNDLWRSGVRGGADATLAGNTPYGIARRAEWESFKETGVTTPAYNGGGVRLTGGVPKIENGQIVNFNELTFTPNDRNATVQNYAIGVSDFLGDFVHSKTFTKLREVVVSYSLPKAIVRKAGLTDVNVSVVGRNLLYWSVRPDIDVDQYTGALLLPFNEENTPRLQSPSTRNFGFNINVTF